MNRRRNFDQEIRRIGETAIRESLVEIAAAIDVAFEGCVIHPGDEIGWLVEMSEPENNKSPAPRWWHPKTGWTLDANNALRFAREKDAEDYINSQSGLSGKPAEHGWIAKLDRKGEGA